MTLLVDGELILFGTVGSVPFFIDDGFTARMVVDALAEVDGDLNVRINSWGGIVNEGVAIHNSLKMFNRGKVTVFVDGVAASAASVIAMAGDRIVAPSNSMMMIHNASGFTFGDKRVHEKQVEILDKFDRQIAGVYAARSGKERDDVLGLMDDETWMTGDEAVAEGFADDVGEALSDDDVENSADPRLLYFQNLPDPIKAMIEKTTASREAKPRGIPAALNSGMEGAKTMTEKQTPSKETETEAGANNAAAEDKAKAVEAAKKDATEAATAKSDDYAKQVNTACKLAGRPDLAGDYIAAKKPIDEVNEDLLKRREEDETHGVNPHNQNDDPNESTWDKSISKVNARVNDRQAITG